jgi:predicted double-glycine peptidase
VQAVFVEPASRATSHVVPAAQDLLATSVVYEVALFKQTPHSYECGPTAVSMLLHYYHAQDDGLPLLAPHEVIQGLGEWYNPSRGVAANRLVRGLQEMDLGYRSIGWNAGLNREQLLVELQEGPVIVQVHVNFAVSGYPHMVVVTGMSEEGSTVHVNDPWTGQRYELAWQTFERSWSFPEYPQASRLVIWLRP